MNQRSQSSTPLTSSSSPSPITNKVPPCLPSCDPTCVRAISSLLEEMVKKNARKHLPQRKSKFYTSTIPKMSVSDYLSRIVKYTHIEESTLLASVICITSYIKKTKNILSLNNIHRLLLASCYINAKFYQDVNFSLKFYAKVGGVSVKELKELEIDFYYGINFALHIEEETFNQYKKIFDSKLKRTI